MIETAPSGPPAAVTPAVIEKMFAQTRDFWRGWIGANAVLMDAYNADVRPLLREVREEMGIDPDPLAAYRKSGYAEKIRAERVGGQAAGWGT